MEGCAHAHHCVPLCKTSYVGLDLRRCDAILFSLGADATHGYPRPNEDKRRAVLTMLQDPEWGGLSNRDIARRCAVHWSTVGRLRASLSQSDSERTCRTKHGTVAVMDTSRIGTLDVTFDSKSPVRGPTSSPSW